MQGDRPLRPGCRQYRPAHRQGERHRRQLRAGLLHPRGLRPRHGAAASADPQDPALLQTGAGRPLGNAGGGADPPHRGDGLVLIGFGHIPRLVAPKAQAFGIKVIAHDPYVKPDVFKAAKVEGVDFDTLLKTSDYVSVHAPLLPATRGMMNAAAFAKMKKGAYLVNTGRGPLIDEPALIVALDAGQIGAAGLAVGAPEPLAKDSPLLGRDNVIISPHTGFYSIEALEELETKCAADVARVLSGEKAVYPISA